MKRFPILAKNYGKAELLELLLSDQIDLYLFGSYIHAEPVFGENFTTKQYGEYWYLSGYFPIVFTENVRKALDAHGHLFEIETKGGFTLSSLGFSLDWYDFFIKESDAERIDSLLFSELAFKRYPSTLYRMLDALCVLQFGASYLKNAKAKNKLIETMESLGYAGEGGKDLEGVIRQHFNVIAKKIRI